MKREAYKQASLEQESDNALGDTGERDSYSDVGALEGSENGHEDSDREMLSEKGRKMANARWNRTDDGSGIPREEFTGTLELGEFSIPCAVLSNGMRVLSERGVTKALGGRRGGSHWERAKSFSETGYRPVFLSADNLVQYTPQSLKVALSQPVEYRAKNGKMGNGVQAILLPEICEVLLEARRRGRLAPTQEHIANAAEILMSGLARVGIIALVDEATGYQEVRERDELRRILEAYVSKELLPWALRFPPEFYQELFRLRGWEWNPISNKRPKRVGMDTCDIIYDRLPPGVLEELRKENPEIRPGYRRYQHHRLLTGNIGNPHLERLVAVATALMKLSKTWVGFKRKLDATHPKPSIQTDLSQIDSSFRDDSEDESE